MLRADRPVSGPGERDPDPIDPGPAPTPDPPFEPGPEPDPETPGLSSRDEDQAAVDTEMSGRIAQVDQAEPGAG